MAKYYLLIKGEQDERLEFDTPHARNAVIANLPNDMEYEKYQDTFDQKEYLKEWRKRNKKHRRKYMREYMRSKRGGLQNPKKKRRNKKILERVNKGESPSLIAREVGLTYASVWRIVKEARKNEKSGF